MLLVTGGAGFIGSNFIIDWLAQHDEPILNVDKLTYAGNLFNLVSVSTDPRHTFFRADIGDQETMADLIGAYKIRAVINFAADSHVDRSIQGPENFIQNNILGTFGLLEAVRAYFGGLSRADKLAFRFVHVSTDEVYGSLEADGSAFSEHHRYAPNSPYSASKAASDHLVRAYHQTFGLPAIITNCSNNYGPFQFPEKLIPLCILQALAGKPLPIYGDGCHIRDWLYVGDHCSALRRVLEAGMPGEVYNIGADCEKTNLEVVQTLCAVLDDERPREDGCSYNEQISFVEDRLGHDRRYAIDASKIGCELNWHPSENFKDGIRKTVQWYLDNEAWLSNINSGAYRDLVEMYHAA